MAGWRVVVMALIYCHFHTCAAQRRTRALYPSYPSSFWVKRGGAPMVNPVFQNSLDDVNLLFEILLAGVKMEDDHSPLVVLDEELASLRCIGKLEAICEDIVPRKLTDIRRLIFHLLHGPPILRRDDFERTVLTLVYTAHRVVNSAGHQRELWTESFYELYKVIEKDLNTA